MLLANKTYGQDFYASGEHDAFKKKQSKLEVKRWLAFGCLNTWGYWYHKTDASYVEVLIGLMQKQTNVGSKAHVKTWENTLKKLPESEQL